MADFIFQRNERFYVQPQTVFGTVPNTSGTATVAGADAVRAIRFAMNNEVATLVRRDKTGSRSATQGVKGRAFGKWSLEASLVTGGAAGTLPDLDPFFIALMGADPVVVASTSVTYNLDDLLKYFTLWSFRTTTAGNAADNRCAYGCVVNQATFNLGQDIAEFTAEGECRWVLRSKRFASSTTDEKGGLTAFPAEPGSPTTAGGIIAGFTGVATLGGNVLSSNIISATINVRPGNQVVKNTFGAYLPTGVEGDERNVSISFSIYDDDSTAVEALRAAGETKTGIDIIIQVGAVAGNIYTFTLKNVQLAAGEVDNNSQRRSVINFPESRAFGTTVTSKDEISIALT